MNPSLLSRVPHVNRLINSSPGKRLWIAIEGIGGSGKTTQCWSLFSKLCSHFPKRKIQIIGEFSNSSLGHFLRANIPNDDFRIQIKGKKSYYLASLLVIADRIQTVDKLVKSKGDIVIFDEFQLSLIAHATTGLSQYIYKDMKEHILKTFKIIIDHFPPLCGKLFTFFLDIKPDIVINRIETRMGSSLKYEHLSFLRRLYSAYIFILKTKPHIHILDADKTEEAITKEILKILGPYLKA